MSRIWSKYLVLQSALVAMLFGSVAAQDISRAEKDAWNAANALGTQQALDSFLANFPDGFFAPNAAAALAGMLEAAAGPPGPNVDEVGPSQPPY